MPTPSSTSANTVCLSSYMKCLKPLFTKIRDKETQHLEFVKYANRLMSVICEEGFAYSRALSSNQGVSIPSSSSVVCADSDESTVIIQTSAGECMVKTPRGGTYYLPAAAAAASAAIASVTTPTNSVFLGRFSDQVQLCFSIVLEPVFFWSYDIQKDPRSTISILWGDRTN